MTFYTKQHKNLLLFLFNFGYMQHFKNDLQHSHGGFQLKFRKF